MSPEVPHQVVTADVPSDERTHSLRQDDCFGLFNEIGDIDAEARSEAGLYRAGVRHLSRFTLTVAGLRPLLLAASPREDNVLLGVNLTNPDVRGEGLARLLSLFVARRIAERDETPFLHAFATNTAAIGLYESIGFRLRRAVNFAVVHRSA